MGPNSAWFHPAQSRYGWQWLAGRYDKNHDGKISADEFPDADKSPELRKLFERLDRDHDGVLTPADFDWSEKSPFVQRSGMVNAWFARVDGNSNGRVSRQEWEDFFRKAAGGKEYLTPEDLRDALMRQPPRPKGAPPPQGPTPAVLIAGLLHGDLGSFFEGPDVGERAPNFNLITHDGKRRIALKEFRGKKPVVLVFGSFT